MSSSAHALSRPFLIEYPARFIRVESHNEIHFEICLGFGLTLKQTVTIDVSDLEASKRVFLQRKLENMLAASRDICLRFLWSHCDDAKPAVDIDVDHEDLLDKLEALGYL